MAKALYFMMVAFMLMNISCATTTLSTSWKDPAYQGPAKKTVVMMVSQKPYIRNLLEDQFVAALKARGNDAIPSYSLIPIEQLNNRDAVDARLSTSGADTVLVSRMVDKKTVETYVPGQVYSVPGYYGSWGSYYGRVVATPGYTFQSQFMFIETNLYDLKGDKLIWSGKSETEMVESDQQLIKTFVGVMTDKLASDKVIR